jgi:hypothetical protein
MTKQEFIEKWMGCWSDPEMKRVMSNEMESDLDSVIDRFASIMRHNSDHKKSSNDTDEYGSQILSRKP